LFRGAIAHVGEKGLDARAALTRRRPGGPGTYPRVAGVAVRSPSSSVVLVEHGVVDLSMTDELRLWPPLRRGQGPLDPDGELREEHGTSGRTTKGVPEQTTISDERTKPNNRRTVF
jgi:hypothetical protein